MRQAKSENSYYMNKNNCDYGLLPFSAKGVGVPNEEPPLTGRKG
jgi:hypothetical protein